MRAQFARAKKWIYTHPLPRLFGWILTALIGNIIAGWLIADLTKISSSGVPYIDWWPPYRAVSFWVAIGYVAVAFLYFRGQYLYDRRSERWNDPEYAVAAAMEELHADLVESARLGIKNGTIKSATDIRSMFGQ